MKKMADKKQLQLIHIAKNQLGLDDDTYIDTLQYRYNVSSSKDLTYNQASALIAMFIKNGFRIPKKREKTTIKKHNKVIRLATPTQYKLIEVLKKNIVWKYENGYELYIQKRFKIDKVISIDDAFKVINGLKGILGIKTNIIEMQALPFPFNPDRFKFSNDGTAWVFDIENKKLIKINSDGGIINE